MSEVDTEKLQALLAGLQQDDQQAWNELVTLSYQRLLGLAAQIFHTDFRKLENKHDTASVLHNALPRLLRDLKNLPQADSQLSTKDYFRLAARAIRQELLDLARYHDRRRNQLSAAEIAQPEQPWYDIFQDLHQDPVEFNIWTEFHSNIQKCLSEEELQIVDLHFYLGYSQAQTAELLQMHPKKVSRIWIQAQLKMADWLPK